MLWPVARLSVDLGACYPFNCDLVRRLPQRHLLLRGYSDHLPVSLAEVPVELRVYFVPSRSFSGIRFKFVSFPPPLDRSEFGQQEVA